MSKKWFLEKKGDEGRDGMVVIDVDFGCVGSATVQKCSTGGLQRACCDGGDFLTWYVKAGEEKR